MELRHLRYFVTVVEEQNFGRAATRLFISQSTLSEQIRSLEREVGGPLLVRTSRRVELTDAGCLLLPEARRAITQADHALRVVRAATAGELGSLRIGFSGVAALSGLLGSDLRAFRLAHPQVQVELVEGAPPALVEMLRDGVIDVAYTPDLGDTADLTTARRTVVHPLVAVPADHPLATAPSIRLADLIDQPLVAFATGHDEWALDLLAEVAPERLRTASTTLGVLALVSAGVGVAVVPGVLECVAMPGVSYRALDVATELAVVVAIRRGEPPVTVRELLRGGATASSGS